MTLGCFSGNRQQLDRPDVKVQIKGAKKGPSLMLYDSGAQLCLLSKKAFRDICVHQRPKKLNVKLTCSGVSGSRLKLLGCYLLELNVLGKKITHPFFVSNRLPGKYEGVIGIDFAKKFGLSYDAITNQPYFEKSEKMLSAATLTKSILSTS